MLLLMIAVVSASGQSRESASSKDLNPGLWEITIQTESPAVGLPATSEVCIAGDQDKLKKPKTNPKDDCQAIDVPAASNEVAFTVTCAKLKRSTSVKFSYLGDRYEGVAVTNLDGIEIRTKYTAKRLGACDSNSATAAEGGR
jgi:hypothetical protein